MRTGRNSFFGVLTIVVLATTASAHELGTIRTTATFHKDGTWVVEFILDREHLPPGFGAPRGSSSRGAPAKATRPCRRVPSCGSG